MIDSKEKFVLIDAREAKDYKKGHIEGAVNLTPKATTSKSLAKYSKDKETKLVFYCANTNCAASGSAAKNAVKSGFKNVYAFEGGIDEWKQLNYNVAM